MRQLKRKGFNLYERAKEDTKLLVNELKDLQYEMKSEQDDVMKNQDKLMQERIAANLITIQEEFVFKTEVAAERIFKENHDKVF